MNNTMRLKKRTVSILIVLFTISTQLFPAIFSSPIVSFPNQERGITVYAEQNDSAENDTTISENEENQAEVHLNISPDSEFDNSALPELDAEAYILIDRKTGQTICSKNPEKRMYPASTTKILTGILALEMGDLNDIMTASEKAIRDIGPGGSNIGIIAGEKMRLENLLDALLVKSANEAANIVAENLANSRADFIALMNQKAVEVGAIDTHFTNTNGFHEDEHYTTAYDLAKIANYAMNNKKFREYVAKRNFVLSPTNKHAEWERMWTTNQLLLEEAVKGFAITGIKTGYTTPAGYCLVTSGIDNNDMELLCVVLGVYGESASSKRFKIATDLLKYGFDNFKSNTFIKENELVETISVIGGVSSDTVDAVSNGTIKIFLPIDKEKWTISRIEYVKSEIIAPVVKGEILGYVEYRDRGKFVGRVNVVAAENIVADKNTTREAPKRKDTGSAFTLSNDIIDLNSTGTKSNSANQTTGVDSNNNLSEEDDIVGNISIISAANNQDDADADEHKNEASTSKSAKSIANNVNSKNNGSDAENDSASTADDEANEEEGKTSFFKSNAFQRTLLIIISLAVVISAIRTINSFLELKRSSGRRPRRRRKRNINKRLH